MKTIFIISILFSFSAFADFSNSHTSLCALAEGNCQLVIAPKDVVEISRTCEGKLADITCRVMMLKTSDSASMNLICGETDSPLLSQVLEAEVLSYNASAIVTSSSGDTLIINDPKEYHLFSSNVLDVQLSVDETTKAKIILSLQDRAIELTNVVCE